MKCALQALLLLAFITGAAHADYLEVRRPATIKQEPQSDAPIYIRPPVGSHLPLLNDGQQTNGYYRVTIPPDLGASARGGWIYRTLVRRFPGSPPPLLIAPSYTQSPLPRTGRGAGPPKSSGRNGMTPLLSHTQYSERLSTKTKTQTTI